MADNKALFDQANKLIRKAKTIEEDDIQNSVKLVREAIKIRPNYLQYDYFLLANYLTMLGHFGKAKEIFEEMLKRLDINDIYFYNTVLSEIYERKCNLLYTKSKWNKFILCYLSADYNKVLGLCSQGKGLTMLDIILKSKSFDEYFVLNKSKLNQTLKNLNAINDKEFIFSTYISYLKDKIKDLDYLSVKGDECFNMNFDYDSEAAEIYYKLNGTEFKNYLNQKLLP
ncbi:MAG: hypothetical protein ACR2NW_00105 [Thermodesulfobacteriota bacterium]